MPNTLLFFKLTPRQCRANPTCNFGDSTRRWVNSWELEITDSVKTITKNNAWNLILFLTSFTAFYLFLRQFKVLWRRKGKVMKTSERNPKERNLEVWNLKSRRRTMAYQQTLVITRRRKYLRRKLPQKCLLKIQFYFRWWWMDLKIWWNRRRKNKVLKPKTGLSATTCLWGTSTS